MNESIDCIPQDTPGSNSVEAVFDRYGDMIYRLAFVRTKNRYDADDILQDVLVRYLRFAPNFASEEHCKAWLIRTTVNRTNSLFSSAWFRRSVPLDDSLQTEMQEKSEVYDAVLKLAPKYRTVVHLFYYEEYTTAEIASILSQKESTVRSQLHRARAQLRTELKGVYDDV